MPLLICNKINNSFLPIFSYSINQISLVIWKLLFTVQTRIQRRSKYYHNCIS